MLAVPAPPADAGWEVPSFTADEIRRRRSPYCVCVFVINEGERIHAQLKKMTPLSDDVDLIVADGGSTDGSLSKEFLAAAGVRALLTKTGPGRLSAQMRMAFAYTLREGYSGILTIDGNDKDDPAAIPLFRRALEEGFDHLQGSRFIPGGAAENTPPARWLAVRLVHAPPISLAAGWRYTDTTNGFRAYSRKFLLDPRVAPFRAVFSDYELHYYLAIRAARLGFRVKEIPVTRRYPVTGKIPTKISPLQGNLKVLNALFKACLQRYNPRGPAPAREPEHG